jgi:hypothetical protein
VLIDGSGKEMMFVIRVRYGMELNQLLQIMLWTMNHKRSIVSLRSHSLCSILIRMNEHKQDSNVCKPSLIFLFLTNQTD